MCYAEEFKREAVKQITERDYPVSEVAKNLVLQPWI
jgi:transposase-like protein